MQKFFNNLRTEIIAGTTTFLTMAYIIFVNPQILGVTGMDKSALIAVTCIASAIGSILVGIFARSPIAMAPGMGLNAFFAYSLVLGHKISWETALGIVFLSGLLFFVLTLLGLRKKIVEAIPQSLLFAISVGIGLFIALIGLVNMGLVVKNEATLIGLGKFTPTVFIGLAGLILMIVMEIFRIQGALLLGIFFSTIIALLSDFVSLPGQIVSTNINILPIALKLDIIGAFKWSFMGAVFSLMFMDMFDSVGTLVACLQKVEGQQKKKKEEHYKNLNTLLGIDALATMLGAVLGTSTTTAYIESGAGIEAGGRKGTTAIVTGILFLLGLIFIPLIGIVPAYATAPALIMVGLYMLKDIVKIDFNNLEEAFPAFIIIIMIALSYSISAGMALGFISFTLIKILQLKFGEIKLTMWVITLLSIFFLVMQ
ncbi:MAG: NCS2 family permease [Candidatus Margulisbacteria bacterium]|nr:NCS2 family permease [Candidatus Margulisiibacteriota bacterium]